MGRTAVVLLHRGDPKDASEVEAYLRALYQDPGSTALPFGAAVQQVLGRWIARLDAKTLKARLEDVGGRVTFFEPLLVAAQALEQALDGAAFGTAGAQWAVRCAFSCRPGGFSTLQKDLLAEGVTRVVGVSLYPHKASRRGGAVVQAFLRAFDDTAGITVSVIERLSTEPGYLELLRSQLAEGAKGLGPLLAGEAVVVCAAPGIEKADFDTGDGYRAAVEETAAALVANSPQKQKVAWLGEKMPGPLLPEVLATLGQAKCPAVLLVPLGTCVDELGVLHGLDVEARKLAKQFGIGRVDRAPQLISETGFPLMLKAAVESHLARIGALGLK